MHESLLSRMTSLAASTEQEKAELEEQVRDLSLHLKTLSKVQGSAMRGEIEEGVLITGTPVKGDGRGKGRKKK
ncbi:hypothetical protein EON64_09205 [archaeon]|nr:MAG: hypothetical protein EON64_09205 [archaeon]